MSFSNRPLQYPAWGAVLILLFARPSSADEPLRLTDDGRLKASPVFVKEGAELVFAVLETPKLFRLMRMELADRSVQPLRKDASSAEFEPACSSDGRYYAFVRQRGVLSLSLAILDTESNTLAEVLPPPGFAGMRSPAFSPDNSRVLYSLAEGGRQSLYSVDIHAGDKKVLTSEGINNWPCFSPDGKRIVFSSTRHGNFEICMMNADGSDFRRLTDSPLQDIRPKFSPDGKRIAFTSHRDGNHEIYMMNADGSGLRRLTNHPERDDYPTWHPDGDRIAFVAERSGQHDIYLMKVP